MPAWDRPRRLILTTRVGDCSTASIVYETFLFGLMMMGVLRGGRDNFGDATLLDIVVRDGTAAFFGVFSECCL